MVRRTVSLPEAIDVLVRESAEPGESFSSATARLIEAGARVLRSGRRPSWIGTGRGRRDELGHRAERYLREALRRR